MLDGGPVLHYLKDQKDNAKSAVMMVGYQAENSNGRMLKEKGRVETMQDGPMDDQVRGHDLRPVGARRPRPAARLHQGLPAGEGRAHALRQP
ncbi:MAG: hypothetical protein MZV70_43715 [Desulfobacterales bacterium]|nr:hypothetical protein [Desulfobacterales bacterium]